ncbi:MAG: hypothetical protein ACI9DG_000862 [Oleispira sp.]|jgi:hypothetical protein
MAGLITNEIEHSFKVFRLSYVGSPIFASISSLGINVIDKITRAVCHS